MTYQSLVGPSEVRSSSMSVLIVECPAERVRVGVSLSVVPSCCSEKLSGSVPWGGSGF